jgi:hypothetical protein
MITRCSLNLFRTQHKQLDIKISGFLMNSQTISIELQLNYKSILSPFIIVGVFIVPFINLAQNLKIFLILLRSLTI